MSIVWSDSAPIYKQLKAHLVAMLLDGELKDGGAFPPVRNVAAQFNLNPITVWRAYRELLDAALLEKRRGAGIFVTEGAREKLVASERERFFKDEWPNVAARIERLGFELEAMGIPLPTKNPEGR